MILQATMMNFRYLTRNYYWLCGAIFTIIPFLSFSQCSPSSFAFGDGEYITYEVNYNIGPIWLKAGRVDFKTKLVNFKGSPCWFITSTGRTVSSIEFLFKVRDSYKTWIDTATYQTVEFQRYIFENGYRLQNTSWFDYRNRIVLSNTKRNDDPLVTDTIRMKRCTYDMISSCFFIRSMKLDTLLPDQSIPVSLAIDDSVYTIQVKLIGKEIIENIDGIQYNCLKFIATMVEGTVFKKEQEAAIWVTDDKNRIPVYIEAKIIVGYIKVYLKSYTGLKYPLAVIKTK